jgi:hypothetical protein
LIEPGGLLVLNLIFTPLLDDVDLKLFDASTPFNDILVILNLVAVQFLFLKSLENILNVLVLLEELLYVLEGQPLYLHLFQVPDPLVHLLFIDLSCLKYQD